MIWRFIGSLAALLTMFGFIPQILKMRKTKSVNDVSIATLIQFGIGVSLWTLYGIYLDDVIIIVANTIIFITIVIAIILYFFYKKTIQ